MKYPRPVPLFISTVGLWLCLSSAFAQHFHPDHKVIYDEDNRVESLEHPDARLRDYAQSVAGMVRDYHLLAKPKVAPKEFNDFRDELLTILGQDFVQENTEFFDRAYSSYVSERKSQAIDLKVTEDKYFYLDKSRTLQRNMRVCATERFAQQEVLSNCTGFLVGEDLLMTAGHCVQTESQCENFKWVFGHFDGVDKIAKKDVYSCKEVISQKLTASIFSTRDYAIIKLDRKVKDRAPLPLKKDGWVDIGEDLAVIGHPSGLPMKTADNARVTRRRINFFYANLDSYAGNSGSPVINVNSGLVEGILIQGANDYNYTDQGCYVSARLEGTRRGSDEKVFRIPRITDLEEILEE